MPEDGSFGGAAAFLGGLTRGFELGEALGERSRRKEAQAWAQQLGSELTQINATRSANAMRITELGNLHKTVGLKAEEFAELENRILNTMSISSEANIRSRDALSRFALGGASNEFIQDNTLRFHEILSAQEAADADMISKWQQSARDLATQAGQEATREETKAENLRTDADRDAQHELMREGVEVDRERLTLDRDKLDAQVEEEQKLPASLVAEIRAQATEATQQHVDTPEGKMELRDLAVKLGWDEYTDRGKLIDVMASRRSDTELDAVRKQVRGESVAEGVAAQPAEDEIGAEATAIRQQIADIDRDLESVGGPGDDSRFITFLSRFLPGPGGQRGAASKQDEKELRVERGRLEAALNKLEADQASKRRGARKK